MTTTVDRIYDEIAAGIVKGDATPGTKLDEQVVADRFGVSRTPVREAFRQLTAAGLIESRPHRGVTVIDLDIDQLSDMFEALGELEAICAAFCADRMSAVQRRQLQALHEEARAVLEKNNSGDYSALNVRFHETIRAGAQNETLSDAVRRLRRRAAPFRQPWLFELRDRLETSFQEHDVLVDAIMNRDRQRAHDAMRDHVANTSVLTIDILIQSRGDKPESRVRSPL